MGIHLWYPVIICRFAQETNNHSEVFRSQAAEDGRLPDQWYMHGSA